MSCAGGSSMWPVPGVPDCRLTHSSPSCASIQTSYIIMASDIIHHHGAIRRIRTQCLNPCAMSLVPPLLLPGALTTALLAACGQSGRWVGSPIKNLSDAGIKSCLVVGAAAAARSSSSISSSSSSDSSIQQQQQHSVAIAAFSNNAAIVARSMPLTQSSNGDNSAASRM